MTTPALEFHDLHLAYVVRGVPRDVLRGVSFAVQPGETYGLVGESGCGKSTAAYAAVRYLPRNARILGGEVHLAGRDVMSLDKHELQELRARNASIVYQDPGQALNPTIKVGPQLMEAFTVIGQNRTDALANAKEMLRKVQIADPDKVLHRYPHQLSGGMQQRVVIAMALASNPQLLILDEPTTGLDATVEAEVLDLVRGLRSEFNTSVLFISHNLGAIRSLCDRVGVLYAGKLVEEGSAQGVFDDPQHPYSVGLLRCLPRHGSRKSAQRLETIPGFLPLLGADLPTCVFVDRCPLASEKCRTDVPEWTNHDGRMVRCHHIDQVHQLAAADLPKGIPATVDRSDGPLLVLNSVSKTFDQGGHQVKAVRDVSLQLFGGETLGLVGESGSGKTTLAHTILGIHAPDTPDSIIFNGKPLKAGTRKRPIEQVRGIQIVFQNPDSALNRRHAVRRIIGRSLRRLAGLSGKDLDAELYSIATSVRLTERHLDMRPSQLSGGLKQRVAIARAFAGRPRIVVCDEPTSALDVSVQAAILNLLGDLQRDRSTSYLFISHDLRVVRYLSDRIAVLYLGRIMELGPAERVFDGPHHPYTEALLSAAPSVDGDQGERIRLEGEIPSAVNIPTGCVFHTRCPRRLPGDVCSTIEPELTATPDGGVIRCHIPFDQLGGQPVSIRTAAAD
ncbi:MAG: ABC transporter ATP-binding protein [Ilumatobacteraceae bacterium]